MEYLEGETLRHLIQAKRLKVDQILNIGVEISGAPKAAHAKGIIDGHVIPLPLHFYTQNTEAALVIVKSDTLG